MSAMRSSWRELESLGGWKADQSTCQDLGSTKNTISASEKREKQQEPLD